LSRARWPAYGGLVLMAALAPCHADPVSSVLACREIADGAQRLACYDRETAALAPPPRAAVAAPALSAAPPVTVAAPVTAAPPVAAATPAIPAPVGQEEAKQNFGLPESKIVAKEVAAGARPADVTRIEAHITALSLTNGRAVFTLDNGQVWRQLLSEGDLLAKPGDGVTISRGLLHSYWLALKSGRGCKVARIL
jgi:hypothetical protein